MIGRKIKLNDYKFTYGQETVFLDVYGAYKNTKNGNKYIVYSYEGDTKVHYGDFHIREKEGVIMASKENPEDQIKEFINLLLEEKKDNKYEILNLDEIDSIQVIDEFTTAFPVDAIKLSALTIPKPKVVVKEEPKKKKPLSIVAISLTALIIVIIAFFFFNPEVLLGKDKIYLCTKSYQHETLPARIEEEITLTFNGRKKITKIEITDDYVFTDYDYYQEFKDKSYFYQYIEEGDTYKFEDDTHTYRLFSQIDTEEDYFLPTEKNELVSYYQNKDYTCKVIESNE